MHSTMLLALSLLSASVQADGVYHIRSLPESELMKMYTSIILDGCRYADRDWHEWPADPLGGYWGNGVSGGDEGIRAIGCMVFTCAALLKYSGVPRGAERQELMRKATSAIRYAVSTHVSAAPIS